MNYLKWFILYVFNISSYLNIFKKSEDNLILYGKVNKYILHIIVYVLYYKY